MPPIRPSDLASIGSSTGEMQRKGQLVRRLINRLGDGLAGAMPGVDVDADESGQLRSQSVSLGEIEMKIPLSKFESVIDPVIVRRGDEYFSNSAVNGLKQLKAGEWIASVEGTKI